MCAMKVVRWFLVFAFYVAAELCSPVGLTPVEAFDGEAEESLHRAAFRRAGRLAPARHEPSSIKPSQTVRRERTTSPARTEAPDRAVRKVPVSASDSPPDPEDQ
jgi:hypothetical protein